MFFGFLSLTSPKIRLREKIVSMGLIFFMFLSCIIRQLDYIWHGFHFTNMIPYRFSFLISFILIVMAFRAFTTIDSISVVGALIATAMSIAVILMMVGDPGTEKMFTDHPDWQIPNLIAIAALTVFIAVVVILYTKRVIPKTVMIIALMVVTIAQSGVTAYLGVNRTTVTGTYEYPRGGENMVNIVNTMNEREADTPELWRAETATTQTLNDGALNHYHGLSMFNSMANENMTRFLHLRRELARHKPLHESQVYHRAQRQGQQYLRPRLGQRVGQRRTVPEHPLHSDGLHDKLRARQLAGEPRPAFRTTYTPDSRSYHRVTPRRKNSPSSRRNTDCTISAVLTPRPHLTSSGTTRLRRTVCI